MAEKEMIQLKDNISDAEAREALVQRVDAAIEAKKRVDQLKAELERAAHALRKTLNDVSIWMDVVDESLTSVSRAGYKVGYEEVESERWDMVIRPITPPDHLDLDES